MFTIIIGYIIWSIASTVFLGGKIADLFKNKK